MQGTPTRREDTIRSRSLQLIKSQGRMRTVDAAHALGISELDLLDAFPEHVLPLRPEFKDIFCSLEHLGPMIGLTRNRHAVIECEGSYTPFAYSEHQALVLGERIDLRISFPRFAFARLVTASNPLKLRAGLLFFDAWGRALHKVFFTDRTAEGATQGLQSQFGDGEATHVQTATAPTPESLERQVSLGDPVDAAALRRAWSEMRDTHDTFAVLRRFGVSRLRALHELGPQWAQRAQPDALWSLLHAVAACELPIMVFVGNPGVTQIFKGPVRQLRLAGGWWNVLDEQFNLHVQYGQLGQSWVVRKPVPEGFVTSLEVFDREGTLAVQVFSYRKPGSEESAEWRATVQALLAPC